MGNKVTTTQIREYKERQKRIKLLRKTSTEQSENCEKKIAEYRELSSQLVSPAELELAASLNSLLQGVSSRPEASMSDWVFHQRQVEYRIFELKTEIVSIARDYANLGDTERCFYCLDSIGENRNTVITATQREEADQLIREEIKKRRKITVGIIAACSIIVCVLAANFILTKIVFPENNYKKALEFEQNKQYVEAIDLFEKYSSYKDSSEHLDYNYNQLAKSWDGINRSSIAAGGWHVAALMSDGTVKAAGIKSCIDTAEWSHIASISASDSLTLGLKYNGRVVGSGRLHYSMLQSEDAGSENLLQIGDWKDIVAIRAGYYFAIGIKKDGMVEICGRDNSIIQEVKTWTDIVDVAVRYNCVFGVKSNGTVVYATTSEEGWMKETKLWSDIIQIALGSDYIAGLKKDGTVVCAGYNYVNYESKPVDEWNDIVKLYYAEQVGVGEIPLIGLRADGRVEYSGQNYKGELDVANWSGIVDIAISGYSTVGLKPNGTVIANFYSARNGENAICQWNNIAVFKDNNEQIMSSLKALKDNDYNAAVKLLNDGKIVDAYESLIALNGYKDSMTKASEIFNQYKIEKLKIADVGDIVYFGAYEQDNDTSNGKEDLAWLVLTKEDGKALIISKCAVDYQQYNTTLGDTSWARCSLRTWMNGTFLNSAFSADEQAKIETANVTADKNPHWITEPGNNTRDKIFFLSVTEAENYFSSDAARQCAPTEYAIAQGADKNDDGNSGWWLRSPGQQSNRAACVSDSGDIYFFGILAYYYCEVRPALWINLDS